MNLAAKSHAKIDGENIQTESSRTFNWTQKQTRHCGLEMYYFLTQQIARMVKQPSNILDKLQKIFLSLFIKALSIYSSLIKPI